MFDADKNLKRLYIFKGGGIKNQTKKVAQNTYSIKFSDTQGDSKFVFEKSSNPFRL